MGLELKKWKEIYYQFLNKSPRTKNKKFSDASDERKLKDHSDCRRKLLFQTVDQMKNSEIY